MPDNLPDRPLEPPTPEDDPLRLFPSHEAALDAVLAAAAATPAPERDADDDLSGQEIRQYHLLHPLGEGGMGRVYAAQQSSPRRLVAVKCLNRAYSGPDQDRFRREAEVLGLLTHPGIARIYEADTGRLKSGRRQSYIAMEYVPDALAITDYAEKHRLGVRERVALFAEVCDAVEHAHNRGVIHRDLKPSNILVTTLDGRPTPKVIDFGIARVADADATQHTHTGVFMGTPDYMSMEQIDNPHDVTRQSDVYSLGAVLYHVLTGRPPRNLRNLSPTRVARNFETQTPDRPSVLRRDLRGDLETIVLKALRTDAKDRYQSAADLAKDLRHYLNREPIEARPPTAFSRVLRWAARHPAYATAATSIVIAALVTAGTLTAVALLAYIPDRLNVSDDRLRATLKSRANNVLLEWPGKEWEDPNTRVSIAKIITRPPELGGGRIALLGFNFHTAPFQTLRAYEPDRYFLNVRRSFESPVWESKFELTDVPEKASSGDALIDPSKMYLFTAGIEDVFPDLPGMEVVALFVAGDRTHTAIRIYDLRGQVLYQVWLDALVGRTYQYWCWLPRARLLVFSGSSGKYGLVHHDPSATGPRNDPAVVFALSPRHDFRTNRYVPLYADEIIDATAFVRPAWAYFVQPIQASAFCGDATVTYLCSNDEEQVRVTIPMRGGGGESTGANVYLLINADGTIVKSANAYPSDENYDAAVESNASLPRSVSAWNLAPLDSPPSPRKPPSRWPWLWAAP